MPSDLAVIDSVQRSNLPASEKSAIARFYDRLTRARGASSMARSAFGGLGQTATKGVTALRYGGEGLVVGGLLGALDGTLSKDPTKSGLDVHVPIGASGIDVPVDAIVGATALGASMLGAVDSVSGDLHTVGAVAIASWSQRMTRDWVRGRQSTATGAAGSTAAIVSGDPVLDWAARQS